MQRWFAKMHGLGNDFIVLDESDGGIPDAATVRALADRRLGIGCDQLLLLQPAPDPAYRAAYRVFNGDGEEAGQCGNGVRCLALLLAERDDDGATLRLAGPTGDVSARVDGRGAVAVDMGEPEFDPESLPFETEQDGPVYHLDLADTTVEFEIASIGNPHAVLAVADVADAAVELIGAGLAQHTDFLRGANVGFAERVGRDRLRLRVFERGVGETRACGTGACAAMAVGRRAGRLSPEVQVDLPGGSLMVSWDGPGATLWMRGPAAKVCEGQVYA